MVHARCTVCGGLQLLRGGPHAMVNNLSTGCVAPAVCSHRFIPSGLHEQPVHLSVNIAWQCAGRAGVSWPHVCQAQVLRTSSRNCGRSAV